MTSEKKAASSSANGKLGGRPRKTQTITQQETQHMTTQRHQAQQLADLAEQNPREWQMHPDAITNGFDGIIFDNGTWTVGSNGDYDSYDSKERAIDALEWSWQQQAELNAE